jgi:nitroreductase
MTNRLISRRTVVAGGVAMAAGVRFSRGAAAETGAGSVAALPSEGGLAPWDYWRSNAGAGALRIASGAILAASPYNTQPWLFRLGSNQIQVIADEKRNLGELDPFRREFYMGLGCAIENACVAAPSQGFNVKVSLLPDGAADAVVATLAFELTTASAHPHQEAIALRHTHRGPYQRDRQVETSALDAFNRQATSPDVKLLLIDARDDAGKAFSDLTLEGTRRILDVESLREGRHAGIRASANGANMDEAAFQKIDKSWLELTQAVTCATAPSFGLIMVRGSRADHRLHIEAGRLWQRVHLEGVQRGLALQPMNHSIEIIDVETRSGGGSSTAARMSLGGAWNGWEPIFGFRVGYADGPAPASGRRPLSVVVVS